MPEYHIDGLSRGSVFAASGKGYVALAASAAATLREVCPDLSIDLYSDHPPPPGSVFNQIHTLEKSWFRPKFEALRRSRFDLTLYFDNDLVFFADITDIFDVLERHDLVAAHNDFRSSQGAVRLWRERIPDAFPQVNGGLLGMRRSAATLSFLERIEAAMHADALKNDQPVIRELLYNSELRLGILPMEYNLMRFRILDGMGTNFAAPRVLHLRALQEHMRSAHRKDRSRSDVVRILGRLRAARFQALLDGDRTLAGKRVRRVYDGPLRRLFNFTSKK